MLEAGIALLVVGVVLLVVEAHVTAGVIGAVGGLAMAGGAALAIAGAGGGLAAVLAATIAASAVAGLWLAIAVRQVFATRKLRAATGREALSGHLGVVRGWTNDGGQVFVDGALWRARRSWADEEGELVQGDSIVVERVSGLTLAVRRAEDWEKP
jgi:membrane-bound serine protease (ClpP class)